MADGTAACVKPPVIPPADPVARTRHATVPGFAHVIDAAYSEADNQFYVAGIPALTGWIATDSGLVETVRYDMGTTDHVVVLGPGRVAVSRRGDSTRGGQVERLAVDDFAECRPSLWMTRPAWPSGRPALHPGGQRGPTQSRHRRPGGPQRFTSLTGLGNPWDLEVVGDYAYVADNTLGLVTLDLADPRARLGRGIERVDCRTWWWPMASPTARRDRGVHVHVRPGSARAGG